MEPAKPVVRIYYLPQSFPCGPQSSCCGPIGQSEEELRHYILEIEQGVPGIAVETVDLSQRTRLGRDLAALKLYNTFGAAACPIIAVDGDVVSMGPPLMAEVVELVKRKLGAGCRR
jgi:hypothetical protein